MSTRKTIFTKGEYYHIYNRGIEKRSVFMDKQDIERFLQSMRLFNSENPIGSIYELSLKNTRIGGPTAKTKELVKFTAYCLNPNHYHLILYQLRDGGIVEFMKRLGGGYTWYFNNRHKRVGPLFQGAFKSIHVDSNEYLLRLSAYVNLNNLTHQFGGPTAKLVRSSWNEYTDNQSAGFCMKNIITDQFKNKVDYKDFAENELGSILERKAEDKLSDLLFDN